MRANIQLEFRVLNVGKQGPNSMSKYLFLAAIGEVDPAENNQSPRISKSISLFTASVQKVSVGGPGWIR